MMKRISCLWVMVIMILSTGAVWAQPPDGGTGGRTGGGIPANADDSGEEIPGIDEIELESRPGIDIDIRTQELREGTSAETPLATIQATRDIPFDRAAFSDRMKTFEVPEDWSQIAALTGEMPTKDEILAMQDNLPHEINFDGLDIQAGSSATATSAIVGYAHSMLGLTVTPLYAGEYGDSDIATTDAAQSTIDTIYSQLDADMQALLTQANSLSGVTYWALLEDGLALVYTGDCEFDQCTIQQDRVQVEVTGGSAGAYALYSDTVVTSSDEARALVRNTYPKLATIELSATESDAGFAFFAFNVDVDTSQVTAYYAGVYTSNGKSTVYVVSGIGDAYINMLLGG